MKKSQPVKTRRITGAAISAVLSEIEAYVLGQRSAPLTWAVLTEFSGFSQVSLWKKLEIRQAFQAAKQRLRADATPAMKTPRTADERISALQTQLDDLRAIVRSYDELWLRYEYNMHRMGLDPEDLRAPLDSVPRAAVRSRRIRSVR
ncbi:MAG: hypothetical protein ACXVAG_17075 [Vulcanimicrobiaceae bacterium]